MNKELDLLTYVISTLPAMADVVSGSVQRPTEYSDTMDFSDWAANTPVGRKLGFSFASLDDARQALSEMLGDEPLFCVAWDESHQILLVALSGDGTRCAVIGEMSL
jgi:hypothetical protein